MLGKNRNYGKNALDKPEARNIVEKLISQYENLVRDDLNPNFLESFRSRLGSARYGNRNIDAFLKEELQEFSRIEKMIQGKNRVMQIQQEAIYRNQAGETHADKILNEIKQRIEIYEKLDIHPDADIEIAKLYGAIAYFDSHYWDCVESYLRRAFPQAGNLDRMSIEQRFWRFVSASDNRVPSVLERYKRILETTTSSVIEKHREAREAIKPLAFFLHDLLNVYERGRKLVEPDEHVKNAMNYITAVIENFRLKALKRNT